MQARALHAEPAGRWAPRRRHADALLPREVLSREGPGLPHAGGGALIDDLTAGLAAPGAELHHPVGAAHRRRVVLDYDHRVADVGEPPQEPEQAVDVRRVQPDGRLVQHIQGVHEVRSQGVGQRDALRLAPGEGAGEAVERQISQPDVVDEGDARRELREDVHRHRTLEGRKRQSRDPVREFARREGRRLRDAVAAHPHRQGLRLESSAAAGGAGLGELVLA